jgi:hypothetical protein
MSDAEWAISPLSFDAANPDVRLQRPELGPEPKEIVFEDLGGTQSERATAIQVYNMLDKQVQRKIAA